MFNCDIYNLRTVYNNIYDYYHVRIKVSSSKQEVVISVMNLALHIAYPTWHYLLMNVLL